MHVLFCSTFIEIPSFAFRLIKTNPTRKKMEERESCVPDRIRSIHAAATLSSLLMDHLLRRRHHLFGRDENLPRGAKRVIKRLTFGAVFIYSIIYPYSIRRRGRTQIFTIMAWKPTLLFVNFMVIVSISRGATSCV